MAVRRLGIARDCRIPMEEQTGLTSLMRRTRGRAGAEASHMLERASACTLSGKYSCEVRCSDGTVWLTSDTIRRSVSMTVHRPCVFDVINVEFTGVTQEEFMSLNPTWSLYCTLISFHKRGAPLGTDINVIRTGAALVEDHMTHVPDRAATRRLKVQFVLTCILSYIRTISKRGV